MSLPLAAPGVAWSEDALLGGRVSLRQPAQGYRVAIDPVLLAAAVPAAAGESVLDIGCGAGAAALCLAARVAGCRVTGIEAQPELARLALDNAARNGFAERMTVVAADLLRPPSWLAPGGFDHVMANPPFLERAAVTPSPDPARVEARIEGEADLAAWLGFALAMTRAKGTLTLIHRADRLEHLLLRLAGRAGEITLFPLWAGPGKPAKRILLRARKAVATPTRLLPGLMLHDAGGGFTAEAEAVLRGGAPLALAERWQALRSMPI